MEKLVVYFTQIIIHTSQGPYLLRNGVWVDGDNHQAEPEIVTLLNKELEKKSTPLKQKVGPDDGDSL